MYISRICFEDCSVINMHDLYLTTSSNSNLNAGYNRQNAWYLADDDQWFSLSGLRSVPCQCQQCWRQGGCVKPQDLPHSSDRACWRGEFRANKSNKFHLSFIQNLITSHQSPQKKQTRVSINSTSQYLVSSGLDGVVNIWDLKTKKLYRNLKVKVYNMNCYRHSMKPKS